MKCCFSHCKKEADESLVKFVDQIYELYMVNKSTKQNDSSYWLCSINSYKINEDDDGYFIYFCDDECLKNFSNMFPCCVKCQGSCDCLDFENDT